MRDDQQRVVDAFCRHLEDDAWIVTCGVTDDGRGVKLEG